MRLFRRFIIAFISIVCVCNFNTLIAQFERPPNIVLIFIDDMGYSDIGPFGARDYPTPNLDRMATEGRRFTDFMVSAPVCSASRAALMTGTFHIRLGVNGAYSPKAKDGLNPREVTIAELCKQKGYATAIYGKWHLGHHPKFLPTSQGFDEYHGIPYSNDMWPWHPRYEGLATDDPKRREVYPDLPLVENDRVVDANVTGDDQKYLTRWASERAVDFIERKRNQPFFLYLPYSMVHVPLFASDAFLGKSGAGLFGDVVMELDHGIGTVFAALRENDLEDNTLVIFTSDNGPWVGYGDHAGSAGPYRESKQTSYDGGVRVPTLFWWPGKIPANTNCDELASTIDVFPTVAKFIGADLPQHKIDGKDIRALLFGEKGARSPHEFFPHYHHGELQAIRNDRWKLVFPHSYRSLNGRPGGKGGLPVKYDSNIAELALYDRANDPGEEINVIDQHPEVYAELLKAAKIFRKELGDKLTKTTGKGIRSVGKLGPNDKQLAW